MPTYTDPISGRAVEYEETKSDFDVWVKALWDPEIKGKCLGWSISIDVRVWREGVMGLLWKQVIGTMEWQTPFTEHEWRKVFIMRRVVRRYCQHHKRIPELHGLAMRLKAI